VGVSPLGLSRGQVPEQADGTETLGGLSPSALALAHWLLRSVTVSYSYQLTSLGSFSNAYAISVDGDPPERLLQPPHFQWSNSDPTSGLASAFSLDFAQVRIEPAGTGAIPLQLWEGSYPYQEILLSTQPVSSHELLDTATFQFFGQPVPLYLQAHPSFNLSGSIDTISVDSEFWEVA
jgi:hypothetical protein